MGNSGPKYNKETGRYEFEDDSDESDHAPLAPPMARKKPEEVKVETKVEEAAPSSVQTTAADLGKPVLNAVMRKRQAQKEKEKKEKEAKK